MINVSCQVHHFDWYLGICRAPGQCSSSNSVVVEHGAHHSTPVEDRTPPRDDIIEQHSDEEESEENRQRLVARDDYRDTHRTGWGNTYNRS